MGASGKMTQAGKKTSGKESQTGTPQREESNILGAQELVEKCLMHPWDSRSKLTKGTEIEAEQASPGEGEEAPGET